MGKTQTRYQAAEGFVHRKVADNDVLISVGGNVANFNGYITLNSTASFLWDALAQRRSSDELERLLTGEFDVSAEIARRDVMQFLQMLQQNAMVTVYEEA